MKKMLALMLVAVLLFSCSTVMANEPVVLESPDIPQPDYSGTLDDMKLGVGVDLGNYVYTPVKAGIFDTFDTWDRNGVYWSELYKSGNNNQYVCLWIEVFNFNSESMKFFQDASVVVVYEGERGTYKYQGASMQCCNDDTDKYNRYYGLRSGENHDVPPLEYRNFLFYGLIPNFVEKNAGEIRIEINVASETLIYVIRR